MKERYDELSNEVQKLNSTVSEYTNYQNQIIQGLTKLSKMTHTKAYQKLIVFLTTLQLE